MITVNNISFGYNDSNTPLFQRLAFSVERGEIINIAGDSGTGKTTLLDIIAGIRQPLEGTIYYNGEPIEGYTPIGYVFADDELVFGSLADFIASGKPVDIARLYDVIRLTGLSKRLGFFIESDGSERLEDQGLSRGEIQKLLLAQALYYNDRCVLFDEAFNHLSFEQSQEIIERLRGLGTTLIMATHRPRIQEMCDRIINVTGTLNR